MNSYCHLRRDAVAVLTERLNHADQEHIFYSDVEILEDEIVYSSIFEKPDYAPTWFYSQNFMGDLLLVHKSQLQLLIAHQGSQAFTSFHALCLAASRLTHKFMHIPESLVSVSSLDILRSAVLNADVDALRQHFESTKTSTTVSRTHDGFPDIVHTLSDHPRVSIVIPTRGDRQRVWGIETCLIANCIRSIQSSTYLDYEIIVVHDLVDELHKDLLELLPLENIKLVWYDKPFNFADKCNFGALHATGDMILLLNDDVQVITKDWLERMLQHFNSTDVGMVGPLLLLEDGRIQTAGHGNNPAPRNLGRLQSLTDKGYFDTYLFTHEVSGVSGACVLVPKEIYFQLGGMSPAFPNNFNDIDFSFKVAEAGYRIIWTPNVQLWHFESLTRDATVTEEEFTLLKSRWGRYFNNEKFVRFPLSKSSPFNYDKQFLSESPHSAEQPFSTIKSPQLP